MPTLKIVSTVENANSTSNSTNQPLAFSARTVHLTNYGATPALVTIVPASGSNTTWIMLANSAITLSKSANDVITTNSTTVSVSKSTVSG
jgi:hypothetical protein